MGLPLVARDEYRDIGAPSAAQPVPMISFGDSWSALGKASAGYNTSYGWLPVLNLLAGQPFRITYAGVDGNTTTMMRDRFVSDVLMQRPLWVTIQAGTVNDPVNGITPDVAIANLQWMCEAAIDAGVKIILVGCPTNGLSTNVANADRRRYIGAMDAWARAYARSQGLYFADIPKYTTDPATGNFFTGVSFDSVHLSTQGCLLAAKGVYQDIGKYFPVIEPGGTYRLDPYNFLGPLGQPTGNNADTVNGFHLNAGCTGTGPNGWAVRRGPGASASAVATSTVATTALNGGGSAGQLIYTANGDDYIDGRWMIGADGLSATAGRWNINWGAGQTITYALRRRPTVANGYSYVPFAITGGGTTGGTEPLWPTEEGGMIVDNEVTWIAQRIPLAGEQLYAELVGSTSALTGNAGIEMRLVYTDTGSTTISTYDNFHTGDATRGQYEDMAHGFFVLRTRVPITVPALGPLQIYIEAKAVGRANSVLTMAIRRAKIGNATREAALGINYF